MTNKTARAAQDFFGLDHSVHPDYFNVVAGQLEFDETDLVESPDLITGPLSWNEAVDVIEGCGTYHFSRIELGHQAMGRSTALLIGKC